MNPLQALMMPVSDDEQMKALAQSLRGRQTAADFFSASSIPNLQKMAQSEQEYIQNVGNRQGVLREAMERRKQDQAQHDAQMAFRYEDLKQRGMDREATNALRMTLAQMRGENTTGIEPLKPGAKTQETYVEGVKLMQDVGAIDSIYAEMDEAQKAQLDQPIEEIGLAAIDLVAPDGVSRLARENLVYTDPKAREYLAAGNRLTQRLSNLAAGLTVTGYEMKARDTWSPFAVGISQEERQIRLNNIGKDLFGKVELQRQLYPALQQLDAIATPEENVQPAGDANGWTPEEQAELEELEQRANGPQP